MAAAAVFHEEVLGGLIVSAAAWPQSVPSLLVGDIFEAEWLTFRARVLYVLHLATHAPDRVYLNAARRLASRVNVLRAKQLEAEDRREDMTFRRVREIFVAQSNVLAVRLRQAQEERRRAEAQELRRTHAVVVALYRHVTAALDEPADAESDA
jgi:hypothetical protein